MKINFDTAPDHWPGQEALNSAGAAEDGKKNGHHSKVCIVHISVVLSSCFILYRHVFRK